MLPQITKLEFDTVTIPEDSSPLGKSFLFDFDKCDFVLKDGKMIELHGFDVLKQWITKVLKTERFRFQIYDGVEYGVTLEDLIGSNFPRSFIEAEIKREVTTSLLRHTHIRSVGNWGFERDDTFMRIKFKVNTVEGTFEQEVTL